MLSNKSTHSCTYMLLFLVLTVNSNRFGVTQSSSSRCSVICFSVSLPVDPCPCLVFVVLQEPEIQVNHHWSPIHQLCTCESRGRTEKCTNQKMHTSGRRWKTNTSTVISIKEKITISNHKAMLTAESKGGGKRDGYLVRMNELPKKLQ